LEKKEERKTLRRGDSRIKKTNTKKRAEKNLGGRGKGQRKIIRAKNIVKTVLLKGREEEGGGGEKRQMKKPTPRKPWGKEDED